MTTNRLPAIVDGDTGKRVLAPVRTPPVKLDTLRHLRDEMGRVYRDARVGKIEPQDATRLAFVLDRLRDLLIAMDLERRIAELERRNQP
jgi:hypothetical protein